MSKGLHHLRLERFDGQLVSLSRCDSSMQLRRFVTGGGSGASEKVRVKNREALYGLSRRLHKAAKKAPACLPQPQQQQQTAAPDKRQQQRQPHPSPAVASPSQSATPQRAKQSSTAQNSGVGTRGRPSRFAAGAAEAAEQLPAGSAETDPASMKASQLADGTSEITEKETLLADGIWEIAALQNGTPASAKERRKKQKKQHAASASTTADVDVDALPAVGAAVPSSATGGGGVPSSTRKQLNSAASIAGSQSVPQRHSRSKSSAAAAAAQLTAAVAATPGAATAGTAATGSPATPAGNAAAFPGLADLPASSQRKSVQFLMKKNLYFEHGGE